MEDTRGGQWVVTAAHCINPYGPSITNIKRLQIGAGSVYLNKQQKQDIPLDTKHIFVHPGWKGATDQPNCNKNCINNCGHSCVACTPKIKGK